MASIRPATAGKDKSYKEKNVLDLFGEEFGGLALDDEHPDDQLQHSARSTPFDNMVSTDEPSVDDDPFAFLDRVPSSVQPIYTTAPLAGPIPGQEHHEPTTEGKATEEERGNHTTLRATVLRPASPIPGNYRDGTFSPTPSRIRSLSNSSASNTTSPLAASSPLNQSPAQTFRSIKLPTMPDAITAFPASSSPTQPSYQKPAPISQSPTHHKKKKQPRRLSASGILKPKVAGPAVGRQRRDSKVKSMESTAAVSTSGEKDGKQDKGEHDEAEDEKHDKQQEQPQGPYPIVVLCISSDTASTNRALSWVLTDTQGLCGPHFQLCLVTCDKGNKDPSHACALLASYKTKIPSHISCETKMLRDDGRGVGHSIKSFVNELQPKLVVCGTKGFGSMWRKMVGSTSIFLVHHCHCPVLVVKASPADHAKHAGKPLHVSIAVDANVHSQRAVEWFLKFADLPKDANMVILYAVAHAEQKPSGRQFLTNFKPVAQHSIKSWHMQSALVYFKDMSPAESIVKYTEEYGCDLLVVASRDLQMVDRNLAGSMSDAMVHHAKCDVLIWKDPLTRELYKLDSTLPLDFQTPLPDSSRRESFQGVSEEEIHETALEYVMSRRTSL
eukprot:gb/GEZN01003380.1/.p1 GENE.gb/GEZN01003380.1/~~gb/GEZN01003380.1/.p1  ORF type:complete len:612 (+),score=75.16 gb/GEZN01003380.1/:62-1897(+)